MRWGHLRVWNDDIIAPHTGFPAHPHRDMEVITYVRSGAITHQDSLGNRGRTEAGDVQVMSAGSGIIHSEMNEENEATQLFQIWIMPDEKGLPPSWGTKPFPKEQRSGSFITLASGLPGDTDALPIRANARLVAATLKAGQSTEYHIAPGRKVYLVPASGEIEINSVVAAAGDGVAISDESLLKVSAQQDSEIVLVDVA
ncbi:pirin family protein [Thiopseudomonas acetoxidans]|uniref:pirin family protein n=1 Tax=Thiopseudomonas acetoxidans TaxID=3041622 RepID=UPI003DA703B0